MAVSGPTWPSAGVAQNTKIGFELSAIAVGSATVFEKRFNQVRNKMENNLSLKDRRGGALIMVVVHGFCRPKG